MKKTSFLLGIIMLIMSCFGLQAAYADGLSLTVDTSDTTDISSPDKIIVSTDSLSDISYVTLYVNGKEAETKTDLNPDGTCEFEYAYDAAGQYELKACAADSDGNTAKCEKTVTVVKNIITDDGISDFSDYESGVDFPSRFNGLVNRDNCSFSAVEFDEERGKSLYALMNGGFGPGGGPWFGYNRRSEYDLEIKFDFMITVSGANVNPCAYDRNGERKEWNPFVVKNGKFSANGENVDVVPEKWYLVTYLVSPQNSTHSLEISDGDSIVLEYHDVPIGKTITRFDDIRFFFGGGNNVGFAFDNFYSKEIQTLPQIKGVSDSLEKDPDSLVDFTSESIYVTYDVGVTSASADDIILKNEIGNVKIKDVSLQDGKVKITPDSDFEPSSLYTVIFGEGVQTADSVPIGTRVMKRFKTTSSQLDAADAEFTDANGNVTFSVNLICSGEEKNLKIILFSLKDGVFASLTAKNVTLSTDTTEVLSGNYESGTFLKALVVNDDLKPIGNKVYTYTVK